MESIEAYKKHFLGKLEDFLAQRQFVVVHCVSLEETYHVSSLNPG